MARIAVDDNLAFVAAALSALTEKQIVPKREYDVIKEKIRKGEDTGYVCKGEANVVEEIKQTYAKTAVLVAMKYHPELVENGELKLFKPDSSTKENSKMKSSRNTSNKKRRKFFGFIRKQSLETRGISKIASQGSDNISAASMAKSSPASPIDTISIPSDINLPTKTMQKITQEPRDTNISDINASKIRYADRTEKTYTYIWKGNRNATGIRLYDMMKDTQGSGNSSASSHSQIDESECSELLRERTTDRKMFLRDSESASSDSGEDYFRIHRRKETKQVPKINQPRMHSGDCRHYSSGEDVSLLNSDKDRLVKKEKRGHHKSENGEDLGETSSEEVVDVFSDDELLSEEGRKQKISSCLLKDKNFEGSKSLQDIYKIQGSDQDPTTLPQDTYHRLQDIELPESRDKHENRELTEPAAQTFKSEAPRDDNCIDLLVVLPSGKTIVVTVESRNCTIAHFKELINAKTGFLEKDQVLQFGANLLRNDATIISDYDITSNSTIHLSIKMRGGKRGRNLYYLDSKYLHPQFDYDFTNMTDDGTKYERGGHTYRRPYGWKRIAIKSLGKYKNDDWLVKTGIKNGEWAVSYHGTEAKNFNPICEQGYKIGPGKSFGEGVYSSPLIDEALDFSKRFTYNGVNYHGILQNRVNPKTVKIKNEELYWVCTNKKDIRPYGLCIRKCTD